MRATFSALVLAAGTAQAQTHAAFHDEFDVLDRSRWYISDGWSNGEHQGCEWNARQVVIADGRLAMNLHERTTRTRSLACSEIQTHARYGHGRYEVRMRSAKGSGLNTAFFTYIGPSTPGAVHDEIDFEFLGKNSRAVEVNFWRAGKSYGGKVVDLGFDAAEEFHVYTFDWSPESIVWKVDGKEVHRVGKEANLPVQTQKIFLSLWSGTSRIADWMGPFRYTGPLRAEVDWVRYTPKP
jgi:endo-1,3-1,4-beta-glycanase ExoK